MADARAGDSYQIEPDFASRQAVLWAITWLVVAVSVGLLVQVRALLPDVLSDLGFLSHGRLLAVHETTLVWGWLSVAGFAAVFALLPRLAEAQLHNEVMGAATVVTWSLALFVGMGTLLGGMNQGRPFAELPGAVDVALFVLMALVLYNAGMTLIRRRERTLYASTWFLLAAVLVLPIVYITGNVPILTGLQDAIASAFYVNAIEWLWLVPIGLGTAFYLIPVETGSGLASTRVAWIAFWTLFFAGGLAGPRLLSGGPLPDYLEAVGVAMTFVLLVPVLSAASVLFSTGRGRWGLMADAFGLRWTATALGLLVVWTLLIAITALPAVAESIGLTAWVSGLRQLMLWGVAGGFAFGFIYRTYPLLVGRAWYSTSLSAFHFWATLIGVAVGVGSLLLQGVIESTVWTLVGPDADVVVTAGELGGLGIGLRVAGVGSTVLVAVAQYAFAFNAYRTARQGPMVTVSYAPRVAVGSGA